MKEGILEILGWMMTQKPFNEIELPADLLEEVADKIKQSLEEK